MEGNDNTNEAITMEEIKSPFSKKEDMIVLLKALFRHGYPEFPSQVLPGMSTEERCSIIKTFLKQTKSIKDRPSIADWIRSGVFEDNDCNVPLALYLIQLGEQHLSTDRKETECNFMEIYYFLYKMTMNQLPSYLSPNSAKILHRALSEIIDEVWPNMQHEFLKYLSKTHNYNRPEKRRMYSGRRMALKKCAAKKHSS